MENTQKISDTATEVRVLGVEDILTSVVGVTSGRIDGINTQAGAIYNSAYEWTDALKEGAAVVVGGILIKNAIKHTNTAIIQASRLQGGFLSQVLAETDPGKSPSAKLSTAANNRRIELIKNYRELSKAHNQIKNGGFSRQTAKNLMELNGRISVNLAKFANEESVKGLLSSPGTTGAGSVPTKLSQAIQGAQYTTDLLAGTGSRKLPAIFNNSSEMKSLTQYIERAGMTGFSSYTPPKGSPGLAGAVEAVENTAVKAAAKNQKVFDKVKSFLGDSNTAKIGGGLLIGWAIYDAINQVKEDTVNTEVTDKIEETIREMNVGADGRAYNAVDFEKRKAWIDAAIQQTTDPDEKKLLEEIKRNNYDVYDYLRSAGKLNELNLPVEKGNDEDKDEGKNQARVLSEEWIKEREENIRNGVNAQFFGALAKKVKLSENQLENTSGDELATGDLQPIDSTPKSEQEVLEQELADTTTRLQKWIQENQENKVLKLLLQKYLNNEELTEEEKAKIKPFIDDYEKLQMLQKKLNDLDGGNKEKSEGKSAQAEDTHSTPKGKAVQGTVPTLTQPVVASTPIARTGAQSALSSEEEKKKKEMANLPPEAIVQQPEEESFWTWKNILLILAAVGTLGIGAYFIIRYKKKADDAKKETSSLQSTVNDLQSQVDDLKGNTDSGNGITTGIDDGLTKPTSLDNVATNITNASLDSTNTILSGNDNTRV